MKRAARAAQAQHAAANTKIEIYKKTTSYQCKRMCACMYNEKSGS